MRTATTVAQNIVRVTGVIQIILGLTFWTGNLQSLIPLHMLIGLILVISLWVLAGLGARAGVGAGLVVLAVVWGLIVPVLGVMQTSLLPGSAHWVIQVLHLLVGLGAIGLAERLATAIKARPEPAGGGPATLTPEAS
jgi:hypothetical protein